MKRHFSVITPQHAPTPRAAWQASASGRTTACITAQLTSGGTIQNASSTMITVAAVLSGLPNRLARAQAAAPVVRIGAGRGAMGVKTAAKSALLDRRSAV